MSDRSFLSALRFFRPKSEKYGCKEEKTADDWGEIRCGQRVWEDFYRKRWQYDKKVRSTHGVNCTGSCSWDVYVKNGILVWETQRTDYPDKDDANWCKHIILSRENGSKKINVTHKEVIR